MCVASQKFGFSTQNLTSHIVAYSLLHMLTLVFLCTQLRLLTFLAPGVNYALALTSVPFSTFFIASAIGLFLPLTFVVVLIENFIRIWGYDVVIAPPPPMLEHMMPIISTTSDTLADIAP